MPLVAEQQLFEYRIIRLLGQGAFGAVYLAQDTLLDRPVAIKELTGASRTDDVAVQRFLREARIAGGLNHPHVVTVHALRIQEPSIYLIMEYVDGGSLRLLMDQHGPFPAEEATRIAADVCDGLAAAHAKGIVHRDIKPENILLTRDRRVKVGDFGIAHVPRSAGGPALTYTGLQPGTLLYMSPEQIRGQAVDSRSDVYQVGVLLYEMLAGRHCIDLEALGQRARETAGSNVMLFQARLCELLADEICERDPPRLRQMRPVISEWIAEAVRAALAKDVQERPTAEDLSRTLRGHSVVEVGRAEPASLVDMKQADVHVNRGVAYAAQGCWEEAIREYQASVHINPALAAAHYNLGLVYGQQGRLDEAIRELQTALRINPADAEAHTSLGVAYGQQGRRDEEIREYQAALRINPALAEAHGNLGAAYAQQGRGGEAIREFQAALHINPDYAAAHRNLGVAYAEQGRLDEAIREYQAALRINPDYADAHYNLGLAYWQQGRVDESIREYQAALCINPADVEAHCNLGVAYARQDRLDEAIREFQAALRIKPDYAKAHYNLGAAYAKHGRLDEATCELTAAAQLGSQRASDMLTQLSQFGYT